MIWVLALEVTDPSGAVALDEEIELPGDRAIPSPDGRYMLGVYGARFDRARGLLEVVAGRERDGKPIARGRRRSDELDPYVPFTATLDRGRDRWTVVATLGRRYAPPPPVAAQDLDCGEGATVTARELRADFPDGTGWTIAAGVPVEARGDGYAISTGGLSFVVDAADVAPTAIPATTFPVGDAALAFPPGVIGATAVGEVRWTGAEPLPVAGISGAREPIVTVRTPCAEVRMTTGLERLSAR